MSLVKFYFTSSMLNMFRTLLHPSSGTCDFSIVSSHWSCVPHFLSLRVPAIQPALVVVPVREKQENAEHTTNVITK